MEGLASDIKERYDRLKDIKSVPECIALRDDVNDWIKYMLDNGNDIESALEYDANVLNHMEYLMLTGPNGKSVERFYRNKFIYCNGKKYTIDQKWLDFEHIIHSLCISTQPETHDRSDLPYPYKLIDRMFDNYGEYYGLKLCELIDSQIRQMGPALLTLSETIRYQLNCRHEPWPEA